MEEEENVRSRVASRFSADIMHLWKQHQRQARPEADVLAEVLAQALQLRHRRLHTEVGEMTFLLEDGQSVEDRHSINQQINQRMRAIQRLDAELQQINRLP